MGYTRTPAHYTASAAYHGGDPVWIRPANLDLRRINPPAGAALGDDGIDLIAMIPQLTQTLATVGTTAVQLREQQIQNQRQDAAQAQATAATNAQTQALEQATAANSAVADPSASPATVATPTAPGMPPAPHGKKGGGMTVPLIIGGTVIGIAVVLALLKLRRG